MKTFRQFINEENVTHSAFVLPREQMPQVINTDHYLNFMDRIGVDYKKSFSGVMDITPTQYDYEDKKVRKLTKELDFSSDKSLDKPIIVSSDGYVLDGHHRYFAAKRIKDSKIKQITIDLPINKLLKITIDYLDLYD